MGVPMKFRRSVPSHPWRLARGLLRVSRRRITDGHWSRERRRRRCFGWDWVHVRLSCALLEQSTSISADLAFQIAVESKRTTVFPVAGLTDPSPTRGQCDQTNQHDDTMHSHISLSNGFIVSPRHIDRKLRTQDSRWAHGQSLTMTAYV